MGSRVLTLVVGGCAAGTHSTIIYKKCHLQDTSSREDTWSATRDSSLDPWPTLPRQVDASRGGLRINVECTNIVTI